MDTTSSQTGEENMIVLSLKNPVMRSFLFACALLTLKVLMMPLMVGRYRFGRGVVISPEDVPMGRVVLGKAEVKYDDPDLERVRRAHLNDVENIPLFMAVGICYVFTMPSATLAAVLFYAYVAFRFLHTIVYAIFVIPQPARFLVYGGAYLITLFMAIMVLVKIPPV